MLSYKKNIKLLITFILTIALVFSFAPILSSNEVHADDTALTVNYKTGSTVNETTTFSAAQLAVMTKSAMSAEKYLAWSSTDSQYTVYNSDAGIPLMDLIEDMIDFNTWPSGWTLEVVGNDNSKATFGYQDINNGKFYGDTTSKTGITTNSTPNSPILSLSTGSTKIEGGNKAVNTDVNNHAASMQFLIGLQAKSESDGRSDARYIQEQGDSSRFVESVKEINIIEPTSISQFEVYTQDGNDKTTRTLVKTFNKNELEKLAKSGKVQSYLQSGSSWSVHATNKYIPLFDLVKAAGIVFNSGDGLLAGDTSQDGKATLSYEDLLTNIYFYPGTTQLSTDVSNPVVVEPVLALNWIGGVAISETAKLTVNRMDFDKANTSGRIYMGVSEKNYLNSAAAGNRFWTAPTRITIIKDTIDTVADANITLNKTTFTTTGNQLKPTATVKMSGVTLKEGTDYTVKYGANKLGKGTVTITGKGNFIGTVTKDFKINPRGTTIKSIKVGKKKATIKWKKAKDAVTGYQIAYKKKGTKKYKVITVKKQKTVSKVIKKLAKNKKYQFKIRTYKTEGKDKYYSTYSNVKTSKKVKK